MCGRFLSHFSCPSLPKSVIHLTARFGVAWSFFFFSSWHDDLWSFSWFYPSICVHGYETLHHHLFLPLPLYRIFYHRITGSLSVNLSISFQFTFSFLFSSVQLWHSFFISFPSSLFLFSFSFFDWLTSFGLQASFSIPFPGEALLGPATISIYLSSHSLTSHWLRREVID